MRLTILSRASDLARLQAMAVERALLVRWPELHVSLVHRPTLGDRDQSSALSTLSDKGAFTADLSDALAEGHADIVVHSWKDLPLESPRETTIAATIVRADPRDVLLIRRDVVERRPVELSVLSSSPRRSWLLQESLPSLLPWPVARVTSAPVRGNIATRLSKLVSGHGDALVVAKAALDRLLSFGPPFEDAARAVREALAKCCWMVLPLRELPGAPAQGALALEIARARVDLRDRLQEISHAPTWRAVQREREILGGYGGGCHQAVGATVLERDYGTIESVRARPDSGGVHVRWTLTNDQSPEPRAAAADVWPRPEERDEPHRRALDVDQPLGTHGYWIVRADALPSTWTTSPDRVVWAAGATTWRKLAARGVWVHGCTDGLGDDEPPNVDALAGHDVSWLRLTHASAADAMDAGAFATYAVDDHLPNDLPSRSHFFWMSGQLFRRAIERWPEIGHRWHASGPGRTRRVIREVLGARGHASVWLDRDDWFKSVTR